MVFRFSIILVSLFFITHAHAQLPVEIQADILQRQIIESLSRNDYASTRDNIKEYKKLGIEIPPVILYIDAKILASSNSNVEALCAIEEYFTVGGRGDKHYQDALNIYENVTSKLGSGVSCEKEKQAQKERKRKAEDASNAAEDASNAAEDASNAAEELENL